MTLWERVEDLARRVGELEGRVAKAVPVAEASASVPRMWGNVNAPGHVWVGVEPPTPEQVAEASAKPIGALEAIGDFGASTRLKSSLTAHEISARGNGFLGGRVVERGELTGPVMQERVERCWDAINRRWGGGTVKSRLTREDSFKEMRLFDAEQVALDAARRWMSLWNVQGPEEDSEHRELYEAMKGLTND